MFPRWHIFFGAIFTALIWLAAPKTSCVYLSLTFISSFLIDFDHYLAFVFKTKNPSLKDSFEYHRKKLIEQQKEIARGIKRKFDDFHFFHTVEFHLLVGILSFLWIGFFFIFAGMMFHSLLDVISLTRDNSLHAREFFLFNWLNKTDNRL